MSILFAVCSHEFERIRMNEKSYSCEFIVYSGGILNYYQKIGMIG